MLKTKEAIILAGGLGTRLQGIVSDVPKPMAPVANAPFLKYILQYLKAQGVGKVVLAVGYKHQVISNYFGNNFEGIHLTYAIEVEPLGTGGGLRLAIEKLVDDKVFVINGDTFFDVDLWALEQLAIEQKSDLCIALKPLNKFDRYGSVEIRGHRVVQFKEKQFVKEGLINGGIYWMKTELLKDFKEGSKFSFEKEVMESKVQNKIFSGLISNTYFIDIGIPEDYQKAQIDFPRSI